MKNAKEIWNALTIDRERVTNGEIVIWYEAGRLMTSPEQAIIPFNDDNAESWEIVVEDDGKPRYCRWYYEDAESGVISINYTQFNPVELEPPEGYKRVKELMTLEEIIGA
jgi:hypothetical protein